MSYCFNRANITRSMEVNKWVRGDADGDGKVNAEDALAILKDAAGIRKISNEQNRNFSDMNFDSRLDAADALSVLRKAVGKADACEMPWTGDPLKILQVADLS